MKKGGLNIGTLRFQHGQLYSSFSFTPTCKNNLDQKAHEGVGLRKSLLKYGTVKTWQPCKARVRAVCQPTPLFAPVIKATWPVRSRPWATWQGQFDSVVQVCDLTNLQCSASRIKFLPKGCRGSNSLLCKSQARIGKCGLLVDKVHIHNLTI